MCEVCKDRDGVRARRRQGNCVCGCQQVRQRCEKPREEGMEKKVV